MLPSLYFSLYIAWASLIDLQEDWNEDAPLEIPDEDAEMPEGARSSSSSIAWLIDAW